MRSLICTDELATDVTGAEALLERHNEHRVEIDARNNAFQVEYFSSKIKIYRILAYKEVVNLKHSFLFTYHYLFKKRLIIIMIKIIYILLF